MAQVCADQKCKSCMVVYCLGIAFFWLKYAEMPWRPWRPEIKSRKSKLPSMDAMGSMAAMVAMNAVDAMDVRVASAMLTANMASV